MSLTQEELKRRFYYDPETGVFTRKNFEKGCKLRRKVGTCNSEGYLSFHINIGKKRHDYKAHRLAWLYVYGCWPKHEIDHINHNKLDNRIANLRDVTRSANLHNCRSFKTKVYGCLGVSFTGKKWVAKVSIDNKQIYLGTFTTKEAAHAAYLAAKLPLLPEGATV